MVSVISLSIIAVIPVVAPYFEPSAAKQNIFWWSASFWALALVVMSGWMVVVDVLAAVVTWRDYLMTEALVKVFVDLVLVNEFDVPLSKSCMSCFPSLSS